ncbi:MAG: hypothetical protein QXF15_00880 [Candidatus Aenigmatarchaeota archaeon]|nr:hypothetical protein [Candidatus Aenigmarchaeota archaeon]
MEINNPNSSWYHGVEKAKEKSKKFIGKIVAVDQNTSIVVGKLINVELDKLWQFQYPYCKLQLSNPLRFRLDGLLQYKMGDFEVFFVNKPEMVMDISELSQRFPKIYENIQKFIKEQRFD